MLTGMTEKVTSKQEYLEQFVGDKVAVICARFQYWGYLSTLVLERERVDGIVLADACCVEQSGASSRKTPEHVDPVGGSLFIACDAIEIVYQPNWSKGPLPSEEDKKKK